MQVIHTRYCPIKWGANLYSIKPGSQVYNSFLGEFLAIHGDTVDVEHCFSSPNEGSVREDHPDIRGRATGMCPGS